MLTDNTVQLSNAIQYVWAYICDVHDINFDIHIEHFILIILIDETTNHQISR